jgi:hypothetical protein
LVVGLAREAVPLFSEGAVVIEVWPDGGEVLALPPPCLGIDGFVSTAGTA